MPSTLSHIATGGLAHFLGLLEGSLQFSNKHSRRLEIYCAHHKPLAFRDFDDLFESNRFFKALIVGRPSWPNHRVDFSSIQESSAPKVWSATSNGSEKKFSWLEAGLPSYCCGGLMCDRHITGGRLSPPKERFKFLLRNLRLSDEVGLRVQEQVPELPSRFIGVHFRNTDRISDLVSTINQTKHALRKSRLETVFWSSDDAKSVALAREHLDSAEIIEIRKPEISRRKNLHFGVSDKDAFSQLTCALADIYVLSSSSLFLPSTGRTGWTGLIKKLREKNRYRRFFLG